MFSSANIFFIVKVILVGAGLFLLAYLLKRFLSWFFQEFDVLKKDKEKTIEPFLKSIINYLAIAIFVIYIISPYVDLSKVLVGAGVVALILSVTLQPFIKDAFIGFVRLYEKQFVVGDFVIINGLYQGTVEEVRIRFVTIREWSGRLLMLSHSHIHELQNYSNEEMKVIENIVIGYQENPEKAKKIIEDVCQKANETYGDWLQVDEDGEILQPFTFYGLTSLNKDYYGLELTLIGCVKPQHFIEASNAIRYELAKATYNEQLRLAERPVLYRLHENN